LNKAKIEYQGGGNMPFTTISSIAVSLIVLGIIVLAHEAGHFFVARLLGFSIEEFSIGFGPRIAKWVHKNIEYSLRVLPLGGFVRFFGEDQSSDDERAFNNQAVWKRILVIASGPIMNFVLAILLAVLVLTTYGDYFPVPVIDSFDENSTAQQAGLKVGDRIIEVNGVKIDDYTEVSAIVRSKPNQELTMKVKRDDEVLEYKVRTYYDEEQKMNRIGIVFGQERIKFGFAEAVSLSISWTFYIIQEMVRFLGNLFFRGQGANELMGPVGTIGLIGQAARQSMEMLIRLAILISINLGIINLVPFPALDGGRLAFLGIEALRGKPLNQEKEGFIHFAGFVILIILMLIVTYRDFTR